MNNLSKIIKTSLIASVFCFGFLANAAEKLSIDVWKSPTCGCCVKWIEHLEKNDFKVVAHNTSSSAQMSLIKTKLGVHKKLRSCHTAIIDGMIVEGHVPADDIKEALKRKDITLLAVPGMPAGSPGMEMSGHKQKYATIGIVGTLEERKAFIFKKHE